MKKLLLSVAILVGATLLLSLENSKDVDNNVTQDELVKMESKLQSES